MTLQDVRQIVNAYSRVVTSLKKSVLLFIFFWLSKHGFSGDLSGEDDYQNSDGLYPDPYQASDRCYISCKIG